MVVGELRGIRPGSWPLTLRPLFSRPGSPPLTPPLFSRPEASPSLPLCPLDLEAGPSLPLCSLDLKPALTPALFSRPGSWPLTPPLFSRPGSQPLTPAVFSRPEAGPSLFACCSLGLSVAAEFHVSDTTLSGWPAAFSLFFKLSNSQTHAITFSDCIVFPYLYVS